MMVPSEKYSSIFRLRRRFFSTPVFCLFTPTPMGVFNNIISARECKHVSEIKENGNES